VLEYFLNWLQNLRQRLRRKLRSSTCAGRHCG